MPPYASCLSLIFAAFQMHFHSISPPPPPSRRLMPEAAFRWFSLMSAFQIIPIRTIQRLLLLFFAHHAMPRIFIFYADARRH